MNEDIIDAIESPEGFRALKHNKYTLFYSMSSICERAAHFGFRTILVLYLIEGHFAMERMEALQIYGWLTGAYMGSKISGAVFGDFIIGNKRSIFLGGILQAVGICCIMMHSIYAFYIGLFLAVFGAGLYSPNLLSSFGKSYLNKIKLLDAGYTIYYLTVNVGSFVGVLLVGYIGEMYGWNFGFALASFLSILSLIPIFFLRDVEKNDLEMDYIPSKSGMKKVAEILMPVVFFWFAFHLATAHVIQLDSVFFDLVNWDIPRSFWAGITSYFFYPVALFASILWTYFYSAQIFKLVIGFACATLSLGLLLLIPDIPKEEFVFLYFIAMFILTIADMYISPVVNSIITQYTSPKYLTTAMTMAAIPIGLIGYAVSNLAINDSFGDSKLLLFSALIIAGFVFLSLVVYLKFENKRRSVT